MLFNDIAILNDDFTISCGMDVLIDGSFIVSIKKSGQEKHPESPGDRGRVINGDGKLLAPGFYNAHTHLPMSLLRGYGENLALMEWLTKKIFPFEDRMIGEDCYNATMLSIAEAFSHGIVSASDQYFFCGDIARAAIESGSKLNVSRGLSYFDELLDLTEFRPYSESRKLYEDFHGAYDGRIKVDIGMHAEHTATPNLIEAVAGLIAETGAPVHVHISETKGEHEECKERNGGRTPTRVLADSGVFDNGGIAAHCVWIEEEDADILKDKGVSVVTCPVSNMKLANGIARIPLVLDKGVNVALGTDGAASNNSLNFFEEIKTAALVTKVRFGDPTLITPREALFMATRAGALAQGRTDCGYIREGYRADMVLLDLGSPSMTPVYDIANTIVYAASSRDIIATIVDGQIVYEKGEFTTVDFEQVRYEVERSRNRILAELGGLKV